MRRIACLALAFGLFIAYATFGTRAADAPTIVTPGQEQFSQAPAPFPAGVMMAVLSGNPTQAGSEYTVRVKLPAGTKLPPHTHTDSENVTVLMGSLMVGLGTTFDAAQMKALPPGSFVSVPARLPHYAMAQGDTVIQISGIGPATMTLVK
jgi:quercetin dioxygenase-like cupin family protein